MSSILIVDDEKDIRELIADILKDVGYLVRLAGNSDDCMAEINSEPQSIGPIWKIMASGVAFHSEPKTNPIPCDSSAGHA